MSTIVLEIVPPGVFDGTTFVPPANFAYTRVGTNHYEATPSGPFVAAAIGVFDFRGMLERINDTVNRGVVDLNSVGAESRTRVSDLVVERGLVVSTASPVLPEVGVTSPPLPGAPNGVADQFTPNILQTGAPNDVFRFGGSGFVTAALTTPGGVVTVPTDYRFFCRTPGGGAPRRLLVWLLANYSCGCWADFGSVNQTGTGG